MANKTELYNLTLFKFGHTRRVNDPADTSAESLNITTVYDRHREAMLTMADWGFARRTVALSPTNSTATGWDYQYSYPNDCLVAREIVRPYRTLPKIPFTTGIIYDEVSGVQKRVINTNEPGASLIYTRNIQLPSLFTPMFNEAFTAWMAADVGKVMAKDQKIPPQLMREFQYFMQEAVRVGEIEAVDFEDVAPDWISQAYGTGTAWNEVPRIDRT